jgi:hypothetical protein
MPLRAYLRDVRDIRRKGNATEHSYRPALKVLLEALRGGIVATNEPTHRTDCGAPDMGVAVGAGAEALPIGYVECKDVGVPLDAVEKSDQLKRYRAHLDNLILTDYVQFRWFVDGKPRASAQLARISGEKLETESGGAEAVAELLGAFLAHAPEPIADPRDLAKRMAKLTRPPAKSRREAVTWGGDLPMPLNVYTREGCSPHLNICRTYRTPKADVSAIIRHEDEHTQANREATKV